MSNDLTEELKPNDNQPGVPEVDDDTTSTESPDQEETNTIHLTADSSSHPVIHYFSSGQAALQALVWANYTMNILSYLYKTLSKVSKGVLRSVQEQLYVFFENTPYPYRYQDIQLQGPGVASIEWYYDADKLLFVAGHMYETSSDYFPRHLPYLSGEIKYDNLVLHDATEFINEIRWVGQGTHPNAKYLLAAWSLQSGIVLTNTEHLSLHCIMESGEEKIIKLNT